MDLKKTWRVVAKADKQIILIGEFDDNSITTTNQPYAFDSDTEDGILDYVSDNGLILPEQPIEETEM